MSDMDESGEAVEKTSTRTSPPAATDDAIEHADDGKAEAVASPAASGPSAGLRQKLLLLKIATRKKQLLDLQRQIAQRVVHLANQHNAPYQPPPPPPPPPPPLPPPPAHQLFDHKQFFVHRPRAALSFSIPSILPFLPPSSLVPPKLPSAAELLARMPHAYLPSTLATASAGAAAAASTTTTSAAKAKRDADVMEQARRHQQRVAEQAEQRQRKEKEKQRKLLRKHFLTILLKQHREAFITFHRSRLKQHTALARAAVKGVEGMERKKKAAEEKYKKDRMKALKENDMQQYLSLLDSHKNDRLTALLHQTDGYLKELGRMMRGERKEAEGDDEVRRPRPYLGKGGRRRKDADVMELPVNHDGLTWADRQALLRQQKQTDGGEMRIEEKEDGEKESTPHEEGAHQKEEKEEREEKEDKMDDAEADVEKDDEKEQEGMAAGDEMMDEDQQRASPSPLPTDVRSADDVLSLNIRRERIVEQPRLLSGGTLKNYQLAGLEWMVGLYNSGMNGILADEMGLGKTVQTISLFAYLMERKHNQGPFLCVVPLSTLNNWLTEFTRFAPDIKCLVYQGNRPTRHHLWNTQVARGEFHVLLTTYEYVINRKDIPRLASVDWQYICVDEGHRMKNAESKLTTILSSRYSSRHRLILTGTPLQNSLRELWSLLNFLLPKIFNSGDNFEDWFNKPFESAGMDRTELDEEEKLLIIHRLHQVLRPFLLRRLKSEVADQLPEKKESVLKCQLSAWQLLMYNQIKNRALATVDRRTGELRPAKLSNTLMQLRKICNHPYLFFEYMGLDWHSTKVDLEIVRSSGKFALLHRMLPKLIRTGHRILIFCQMTRLMDVMEEYFEWRGMKWLRLDGNYAAADRNAALDAFNAADSPYAIFLLSTRAGGLGLNLQTADTVIIFDSDWNPQMDIQAQDRAHRVGQKKEVRVFRLISMSPVEEEILERARFKLGIDQMVIQSGKFNASSSVDERKDFLAHVLREGVKHGPEVRAPSDEEINKLMARSEAELELFTKIDLEIEDEDRQLWVEAGGSANGPPSRLMMDEEVPEYVRDAEARMEADAKTAQQEEGELGRGGQGRKGRAVSVSYHEELTDREFERALERGEDPYEMAMRKQEKRLLIEQGIIEDEPKKTKKRKRKGKAARPAGEADGEGGAVVEDEDESSSGSESSSSSSSGEDDDRDGAVVEQNGLREEDEADEGMRPKQPAARGRGQRGRRGRGRGRGRGRDRGRGRSSTRGAVAAAAAAPRSEVVDVDGVVEPDNGADASEAGEASSDVEEQRPAAKKLKTEEEAKQPSHSPLRSSPPPPSRLAAAARSSPPLLIDHLVPVSSRAAVSAVNQTLDSFLAPFSVDGGGGRKGKKQQQQQQLVEEETSGQEEMKVRVEERAEERDIVELDDVEEVNDDLPLSELLSNGKDEAEPLPAAKSRGRGRNTPSPQLIAAPRRSSRRSLR